MCSNDNNNRYYFVDKFEFLRKKLKENNNNLNIYEYVSSYLKETFYLTDNYFISDNPNSFIVINNIKNNKQLFEYYYSEIEEKYSHYGNNRYGLMGMGSVISNINKRINNNNIMNEIYNLLEHLKFHSFHYGIIIDNIDFIKISLRYEQQQQHNDNEYNVIYIDMTFDAVFNK